MYRMLAVLVVAVLTMTTLAAPTPTKTISKRSFAAKVKGHRKLSGPQALQRAARKYGFDVSIPETEGNARRWDFGEAFSHHHHHHDDSDSARPSNWPAPSVIYSILSSIEGISASAVPSGFGGGSSSFAVSPSSAASSGIVASSSAPPVQSSAPASSVSAPASSASAPAPSSSSPAGSGSATGEVQATPEESGSLYVAPVSIGGQQLNLDFDTGSSDLWVFDSQASSGHTAFDPSKSKTFQALQGGSWSISYGDGSMASGTVGFDAVTIGGVTAPKQCVELAQKVSSTFVQDPSSDGLIGLAFSSINQVQPQKQKTFFDNVMPNLEKPVFTADLEKDASGTYEFGTIDSSKFSGQISYTPVDNSQGFWGVTSASYTVGETQHSCSGCSPAIMDTGTSLILVDESVVTSYYQQVQGAELQDGAYVYPCSASLPDFGVAIGDYTAVIKGADVTFEETSPGSGTCFGGIQSSQGSGFRIFGDVFFKQFFAVFDGGNLQFGVAPKA